MKLGIIQFPGSTGLCDLEYVLKDMLDQDVEIVWHKDGGVFRFDLLFIPDGSSFSDYLRPGAVAGKSDIMKEVSDYASQGGFVIGIGNGFSILCESELLPGAMLRNQGMSYMCKNVFIKSDNNYSVINQAIDKEMVLKVPVSGKYLRYFIDEDDIVDLRYNEQITFRYCDRDGRTSEKANFAGSVENIAGVCNKRKNVFGLNFNPEKACDDELGNTDGKYVFQSILANIAR
jgi:phosphoribosylformylglycinamidine synthase